MTLTFQEKNHSYQSIDSDDSIIWLSSTRFVECFKQKFDAKAQSIKSSKNKKSKWYGIDPKTIIQTWDNEANRATTLGTFYHNQRESDICSLVSMVFFKCDIRVVTLIQLIGSVNSTLL